MAVQTPPGAPGSTLNESPSEKEGKFTWTDYTLKRLIPLNESPSEKEGKLYKGRTYAISKKEPSMKVPPKRKGNSESVSDFLDHVHPQ